MPLTPLDFISKWKRVTAREKHTDQKHFLDRYQFVGHQTPNDYDGSGGQGWANDWTISF